MSAQISNPVTHDLNINQAANEISMGRRRRLPTVADVARGHDIGRQHIYQLRRELRAKGLWNDREDMRFLRLPVAEAPRPGTGPAAVEIVLCNGRALRGVEGLGADDLARLIRVVESA